MLKNFFIFSCCFPWKLCQKDYFVQSMTMKLFNEWNAWSKVLEQNFVASQISMKDIEQKHFQTSRITSLCTKNTKWRDSMGAKRVKTNSIICTKTNFFFIIEIFMYDIITFIETLFNSCVNCIQDGISINPWYFFGY